MVASCRLHVLLRLQNLKMCQNVRSKMRWSRADSEVLHLSVCHALFPYFPKLFPSCQGTIGILENCPRRESLLPCRWSLYRTLLSHRTLDHNSYELGEEHVDNAAGHNRYQFLLAEFHHPTELISLSIRLVKLHAGLRNFIALHWRISCSDTSA